MGEVTYIAERSKRSRFEAPVQVEECPIYCPCAIILKILHPHGRRAALARTPTIALVMAASASAMIICGRIAHQRDGHRWSTRISIHHSL